MDTKALRQKILDLAIRGKLVPQDPNDEPAEVLLERIREQKQQMLKEGKLKKKDIKNDTIIFKSEDNLHYEKFQDGTVKCIEDEIPFEVPEGWAWTRFSAITINRDSERKPISSSQRTDVAKIYDYYGASGKIDKIDKYIFNERLLLIGEDGANLVTRNKPIAFFAEGQYWVNNHAHCIDATDKFILEYLCFYINAISLEKYVTGSAQPKMTQDNMNSILIPLPPYSEQKHMSQRLNEVMYTVDNIEIGKADINELVSKAKSKILDLAIRGKLVPQDPNDEPASVLLEHIRSEKEELIKQGKIKHDKKESVIFKGDDNSYYGIHLPDSWNWASLREIALSISDGSHNPPPNNGSDIPLLSAANINDNSILMNEISRWITNEEWKIENQRTNIEVGDVLLTIVGSIGRSAVVQNNNHFALQRSVAVIKPCLINPLYLMHIVQSPQIQKWLTDNSKGTAQKGIYLNALSLMIIPIPPLEEQARIVERIHITYKQLDLISNALL